MDILIIVLLVLFIYFVHVNLNTCEENFTIVAYNNFKVPDTVIETVFDKETKSLEEVLNKMNEKLKNQENLRQMNTKSPIKEVNVPSELTDISDMRTLNFSYYNTIIPFPYNDIIKEYVYNYLKTELKEYYGEDKIELIGELFNMFYFIKEKDVYIICDMRLLNKNKFSARVFRVKLRFSQCDDLVDYLTNKINTIEKLTCQIELLHVILKDANEDIFVKYKVKGLDILDDNEYYRILNKLSLLGPFKTSRDVDENNLF